MQVRPKEMYRKGHFLQFICIFASSFGKYYVILRRIRRQISFFACKTKKNENSQQYY